MAQQLAADFDIDPDTTSGPELADILDRFSNALNTMRSGNTRPAGATAGTVWLDTNVSHTPYHYSYFYDGTADILLFTLNTSSNTIVFEDSYLTAKGSSFAISLDGSALANDDGTDNDNIAIGKNAGNLISSGYNNNLLGLEAGSAITTGWNHCLIGYYAGSLLTNQSDNCFIGSSSGINVKSSNNVGIGSFALSGPYPAGVTGGSNVSIGENSGLNVTTGNNNTFVGVNAGRYSNAAASTNLTTFNSTICLGIGAYATATGEMSLGNSTYISTAFTAATFTQRSDERLKNISDIDLGLDFINSIVPIKYTWVEGADKNSINYGFSAQQVKSVLEDKVGNDKRYMHSVRGDEQNLAYTEFVAPLVKAVQELSTENQQLKNDYNSLLKRVIALENKEG